MTRIRVHQAVGIIIQYIDELESTIVDDVMIEKWLLPDAGLVRMNLFELRE